ncbi:MAG: TadE/TadG family type IV pilus assembly protein [Pseudomonadota bacterium]
MLFLKRKIGQFRNSECGATAVEFSIVAVPFLLAVFGIIELGMKSMQQTELDANVYAVASKVSTDQFDDADIIQFSNNSLCSDYAFEILDCSKVRIGIAPVVGRMFDYRNQSIVGQWDIGCANDTLIVELHYPVVHILHSFAVADVVMHENAEYFRSRGVVRREPILTGSATC